ncbi:asporin [Scleropages formosus]|uniref:Asporin n=1 Tax=Scleropages formosus TaxID=113540 RepID=A0A8C9QZE7_SCLFO|nr:asporin [Scleropages formosus]XP_018600136.1 asporin [Scleropages formosus]
MREFLLLALLALCRARPYEPLSALDFLMSRDMMMLDAVDEDDDNDDDDDDDDDNFLFPPRRFLPLGPPEHECPFACQCSRRVVQCSDLGLKAVPKNIPSDALLIDLQNNKISEIKENDFKGIKNLYALFLVNNKITKIHPQAFRSMDNLQLLYLSYNLMTQIPANLPKNILELRIHDNKINRIQKDAFHGMRSLHVLEMSANPLANNGIDMGAFDGMGALYVRIAEARLTAVPKDLPSSITELHLDYNKIGKVEIEDFIRYKRLRRLGLGFNQIKFVENGSLASTPNLRELHLDNNKLKKVPPGLDLLKYLQVVYLHGNQITSVGVNEFCPARSMKKSPYTGISLFANPLKYWEVQPATFRCVSGRRGVQMGNFRRK